MEPFKIKAVEPLPLLTRRARRVALERAGYNLLNLRADEITIDLLTDSGTNALSARQLGLAMEGDESYAGSASFYRFLDEASDLTGFAHILPVHQGRAAERILFTALVQPGQISLSNRHFETTRANIQICGGEARDLPCTEAQETQTASPFKGNIDLELLERTLGGPDRPHIAAVVMTVTDNEGGGQPVSLAHFQEVARVCRAHHVPLFLDAARIAENAWLIKQREPACAQLSPREIVQRMFALADGCMMSGKKDALVHIGGFLALNDSELAARCELLLFATEGFSTYGGLAGRDLDMMAQGLREVVDPAYLDYRARESEYLAEKLRDGGIRLVEPPGLHALFVDARHLLPNHTPSQYPAHAVACELYLQAGVRATEVGSLHLGRHDPQGDLVQPAHAELVRLCLPRRVYTRNHWDHVAQALCDIAVRASEIPRYSISEYPPLLGQIRARLRPQAP